jgi:hypothetical protein
MKVIQKTLRLLPVMLAPGRGIQGKVNSDGFVAKNHLLANVKYFWATVALKMAMIRRIPLLAKR